MTGDLPCNVLLGPSNPLFGKLLLSLLRLTLLNITLLSRRLLLLLLSIHLVTT